jgi:hypothetical protein
MCQITPEFQAMNRLFTEARLKRENLAFFGTPGVSQGNSGYGFIPAFCDSVTGRVEISRLPNGQLAPIHMIEGLPKSWIVQRDATAKPTAVKLSIVAGFVRGGCFYTRAQAAEMVLAEMDNRAED